MIDGAIKNHEVRLHKRPRTVFVPPTVEEIDAYCIEKGVDVLPEYIWNFYEKKGWKVGKNLMKNWKSAVSQAQYWESVPRRKLPSKPDPEAEAKKLEELREEKRKDHGKFFREQTIEELKAMRKAGILLHLWWLIDEILAEKQMP